MIQIPIHYFTSTKKEDLNKEIDQFEEQRGFYGDYFIILLRYKYSWEKDWTEDAEIIYHDGMSDGLCWLMDWNEGHQDIEYIGLIDVNEIDKIFFTNRKKGIVKQ